MSLVKFSKQETLVGPWGGSDGLYWDDGAYSTVRQLEIYHGTAIDSIRIEYDSDGRSVWSEKHGGTGGSKIDKIRLDYPDEFLNSLHGHYGRLQDWGHGPVVIRSLTFVSNRRSYGPFGVEHGTYFSVPKTSGKIVGFVGKSGWLLDAIGLYMEPLHKHIVSKAMYSSHEYVAHETQRVEYSMIQGGLGPDYDFVLAVKQNGAQKANPPNHHFSQTPHDFGHVDTKNQIAVAAVSNKVERAPLTKVGAVVTYGPWGGSGGSLFDDGVYDGIRQIKISRNVGMVSIRVTYDQNGHSIRGSKNGGTGSFKSDKIVFDYPLEILTHVTGYYGPTLGMGPNVIKSLSFHTTKGFYGPYGEEEGKFFSTRVKEGSMIIGFHGRKGLFLDSIGVHVLEGNVKSISTSPISNLTKPAPNSHWPFRMGKKGQPEEVSQRLVKDPVPYGPGPWGGEGGKPWDDGVFTGIKQIILTRIDAVSCIEIEYDRSGQSVWSVKHGGSTGHIAHRVKLDHPHEVLTSISGYYGPRKDQGDVRVIQSLSFHSSRRTYGPFGDEIGTYFASGMTEGKVVGFHGRSSMNLDAIGVHMQHWLGNQKPYKPPTLMKMFS